MGAQFDNYPDLMEYVAVEEGLARVVNQPTIYKKILNTFLTSTYFEDFCAQVKSGDSAAAATLHALKGVTANLSLKKINEICISVEQKIKNGEDVSGDLDEMAEIMNKTKEYVEIVIQTI